MRFDIIVDLAAPMPEFLIKRAKKMVLDVATERLRERVMAQRVAIGRCRGRPRSHGRS